VNDFWDFNALTDLPGVFREAQAWQGVSGLTPGHWPDLDMLPLGYLGPRNEWHASGQTTFSRNDQVTILSLWSILPSPLMFGGNPARLGTDAWTTALLTNEEVLAVNQDVLGARGRRTAVTGGEFWVRDLSGGRKAVAFFNRGTADAMMSATFAQIGVTGTPTIRNLWQRTNVTGMTTSLSASVPGGAALMYTLSPPSSGGAGGMGGAAGAAGIGGAIGGGAGGAAGTAGGGASGSAGSASGGAGPGGTSGAAGSNASSGSNGVSGGGGTAGTGVGGSTGGTTGAAGSTGGIGLPAGSGGTNAAGNDAGSSATNGGARDAGGCGCTLPTGGSTPTALFLLGTAALGMLRSRRRRR